MSVIVLDADAVIRHGRAFPEAVRSAAKRGERLVLPDPVRKELVDDVLDGDPPENHRRSAEMIQSLIDQGTEDHRTIEYTVTRRGERELEARREWGDQLIEDGL